MKRSCQIWESPHTACAKAKLFLSLDQNGKHVIHTNPDIMGYLYDNWGFPHSSVGKESACNAGVLGSISGWEDLQKGKATHSSSLAWRIPWTV